jgi:HSP20 family molecular chaperone IbpA
MAGSSPRPARWGFVSAIEPPNVHARWARVCATEFYHALTIPQYVDTDNIDASYKQGVLQVSLPKTDEGKGRKIAVKG